MARRKHVPQRMCVACRESQDKNTLVRIVRTPDGVCVDESGKLSGRGAYLHAEPICWERGLKKFLEKSLMVEISSADRERLIQYQDSFPNQNNQADDDVD